MKIIFVGLLVCQVTARQQPSAEGQSPSNKCYICLNAGVFFSFLLLGLNDSEEMSLIDIMVCACKQAATRQGPPGRTARKSKETKSSMDDKRNLSAHFMQTLPSLLNKVNNLCFDLCRLYFHHCTTIHVVTLGNSTILIWHSFVVIELRICSHLLCWGNNLNLKFS